MKRIGIVGHEEAKFTDDQRLIARWRIALIARRGDIVVSGHCHLGGVDIWAEDCAKAANLQAEIYPPAKFCWAGGYRERNIQIANASDEVHCIVVAQYPPGYKGMRFGHCYHCKTDTHIKSGGCWTAKYAENLGKPAFWHVIP